MMDSMKRNEKEKRRIDFFVLRARPQGPILQTCLLYPTDGTIKIEAKNLRQELRHSVVFFQKLRNCCREKSNSSGDNL